jgi:uncharacterized protein YkwD
MYKRRFYKTMTLSFLTLTLVTTSWSSAFATTAWAATTNESPQEITSADDKATNSMATGLLALGLVTVLSNRGDKGNTSASPSKSTAPASTPSNSAEPSSSSQSSNRLSVDEQRAFDLVNADRKANKLPPLKLNLAVSAVAQRHAQDEISRNFFAHNNPDGQSPFDRMRIAGISYSYAGENLAINQNVTAAEQAFMNSPGHRANILNANYTEVGIGVRYSPQGSVYVVQNFIRP